MTTLTDRPNTALLVIDMQQGVVGGAHDLDKVVANIDDLVDRAHASDTPVIWIQHADDELERGSDAWRWIPELAPRDHDPVVHKSYGDAFEATVLETVLAGQHVGHLVVTGAQSDACIRSTHARRVRARLRRHARGRRPHHRRPQRVGRADARPGDLAHQPLLAASSRGPGREAGTVGRRRRRRSDA